MSQFAIKDAGNVLVKNRATNEPLFYSRTPNKFNIKLDADSVYAKAKGSNAIAFDGAITASLTLEQEVITFEQLPIILSSSVEKKAAKISKRFVGKLDGSLKLIIPNSKFVSGSVSLFELDKDGVSLSKKLSASPSQQSENIEITASGTDSAGEGVAEHLNVVAFYLEEVPAAKTITIKDESTAENYVIHADVAVKCADGTFMALYATFNNCKAQRAIELGLDAENPVNFSTTFDMLPDENGEYAEFAFIEDGQVSPVQFMKMNNFKSAPAPVKSK